MSSEGTLNSIQQRATVYLRRAAAVVPEEYRGELWIYAAGFVFLYTLLILFSMSTIGFICTIIYIALINLLILRCFGLGPLASS